MAIVSGWRPSISVSLDPEKDSADHDLSRTTRRPLVNFRSHVFSYLARCNGDRPFSGVFATEEIVNLNDVKLDGAPFRDQAASIVFKRDSNFMVMRYSPETAVLRDASILKPPRHRLRALHPRLRPHPLLRPQTNGSLSGLRPLVGRLVNGLKTRSMYRPHLVQT